MPPPHPPEFRRRAIELARERAKPIAQIAADIGISESCLGTWMHQADIDEGRCEGLSTEERVELVRLRRGNRCGHLPHSDPSVSAHLWRIGRNGGAAFAVGQQLFVHVGPEADPLIQVVILTAYDRPLPERSAEQVGAYAYLVKGCPPELIRDVISQAWEYGAGLRTRGLPGQAAGEGGSRPPG